MANRFEGKMGRGASRMVRAEKRREAEERNSKTPVERTKKFRKAQV